MANNPLTGRNLWMETDGRFRNFSVAESDRAEAERLALSREPKAKIVHANELPHSVMVFLKAKRGQIVEWVSAEPGKPIEPLLRKKAE
jgi:hypothetical protein